MATLGQTSPVLIVLVVGGGDKKKKLVLACRAWLPKENSLSFSVSVSLTVLSVYVCFPPTPVLLWLPTQRGTEEHQRGKKTLSHSLLHTHAHTYTHSSHPSQRSTNSSCQAPPISPPLHPVFLPPILNTPPSPPTISQASQCGSGHPHVCTIYNSPCPSTLTPDKR